MDTRIAETSIVSIRPIEAIYSQILPQMSAAHTNDHLNIDCSQINFIRVDGLLALLNIARLWHRRTGQSAILCAMKPQVHHYFERMDVFKHCQEFIETDGMAPPNNPYDRLQESERLLELTPIASEKNQNAKDVQQAMSRADKILKSSLQCAPSIIRHLLTILSEVTSNIVHSMDNGYVIIQRHSKCIVISVTDLGIGIQASLSKDPARLDPEVRTKLCSGSDYIDHALNLGSTSRSTPGGMGLHQIRSIVADLRGSLTIRSFSSLVRIDSKKTLTPTDNLPQLPGTQVTISVRE